MYKFNIKLQFTEYKMPKTLKNTIIEYPKMRN